jgi:hypothetical protein
MLIYRYNSNVMDKLKDNISECPRYLVVENQEFLSRRRLRKFYEHPTITKVNKFQNLKIRSRIKIKSVYPAKVFTLLSHLKQKQFFTSG